MDEHRIEVLIERYFDGWITADEMEALDAALASDPDAARRFARAARMEAALEQHFRTLRAEAVVPLIGSTPTAPDGPDPDPTARGRMRKVFDHLWGPSLAVLAHAALLLVLLRWALLPAPLPPPPFSVTLQPDSAFELDAGVAPAPPEAGLDISPPMMTLRPREPEPLDAFPPPAPVRLFPRPAEQVLIEPPAPLWPEWYAGRTLKARRERLLAFGSDEAGAMDEAAESALAILARLQRPDGSWPAIADGGSRQSTAFAVLAFLSRGHLPGHPLYGSAVEAGLRWLIDPPAGAGADPLDAGALALAEAFMMTRIPSLAAIVRDQSRRLMEEQRADGGWSAGAGGSDLVATAWRTHSLVTARAAGLASDDLDAALRRAAAFSLNAIAPSGAVTRAPEARRVDPGHAFELAAAWRTLQLVGDGQSADARRIERQLRQLLRAARQTTDPWPLLPLHETALALAVGQAEGEDSAADFRFVLQRALAGWSRGFASRSDPEPVALMALTLGAPYRYHGEAPHPGGFAMTLSLARVGSP